MFNLDFFGPMLSSSDTTLYAITADGEIAGFMRLAGTEVEGAAETGMWLGRSWRGKGIGGAALRRLLDEARAAGYGKVVADTTPRNSAALAALRRAGAQLRITPDKIYAEISCSGSARSRGDRPDPRQEHGCA